MGKQLNANAMDWRMRRSQPRLAAGGCGPACRDKRQQEDLQDLRGRLGKACASRDTAKCGRNRNPKTPLQPIHCCMHSPMAQSEGVFQFSYRSLRKCWRAAKRKGAQVAKGRKHSLSTIPGQHESSLELTKCDHGSLFSRYIIYSMVAITI
jgi:hypothetical protein